jgi:hypothetical protein
MHPQIWLGLGAPAEVPLGLTDSGGRDWAQVLMTAAQAHRRHVQALLLHHRRGADAAEDTREHGAPRSRKRGGGHAAPAGWQVLATPSRGDQGTSQSPNSRLANVASNSRAGGRRGWRHLGRRRAAIPGGAVKGVLPGGMQARCPKPPTKITRQRGPTATMPETVVSVGVARDDPTPLGPRDAGSVVKKRSRHHSRGKLSRWEVHPLRAQCPQRPQSRSHRRQARYRPRRHSPRSCCRQALRSDGGPLPESPRRMPCL